MQWNIGCVGKRRFSYKQFRPSPLFYCREWLLKSTSIKHLYSFIQLNCITRFCPLCSTPKRRIFTTRNPRSDNNKKTSSNFGQVSSDPVFWPRRCSLFRLVLARVSWRPQSSSISQQVRCCSDLQLPSQDGRDDGSGWQRQIGAGWMRIRTLRAVRYPPIMEEFTDDDRVAINHRRSSGAYTSWSETTIGPNIQSARSKSYSAGPAIVGHKSSWQKRPSGRGLDHRCMFTTQ